MQFIKFNSHRRRPRRTTPRRKGVASVEFAFIFPVLISLTLGTMDVCSVIFLKETAVLAAYEGARQGVNRGRTNADAKARVLEFLDARGINYNAGTVVRISNPGYDTAPTLQAVTLTVSIPAEGNVFVPTWLFAPLKIEAACTLRKEYKNVL